MQIFSILLNFSRLGIFRSKLKTFHVDSVDVFRVLVDLVITKRSQASDSKPVGFQMFHQHLHGILVCAKVGEKRSFGYLPAIRGLDNKYEM